MKKLFVVSDIHGFYDELRMALDDAGFDPNDENSYLVVCGDTLDRGDQPQQVIDYLSSLPRCILIRGNHEELMEDMIERGYHQRHDWSNGTMGSALGLAPNTKTAEAAFAIAYEKIKPFFAKMVNYFETERYVFCHSWVPVDSEDDMPYYYRRNRKFTKNEDWRYAHQSEWDQAMWLNPLHMAMNGFGIEKTIVSGHWHCSYGHHLASIKTDNWTSEFEEDACFDPYYYKDELIMIDACTAHTKKVNVLVLEDEFME